MPLPDKNYFTAYEEAWRRVTAEWSEGDSSSRPDLQMWRTYAANYLFRQIDVAWAVDPFLPYALLGHPYPEEVPLPLRQLDVILLSHRHADHWDSHLLKKLSTEAIQWLVPPFLSDELQEYGVPSDQIVVLRPGEIWKRGGLQVQAHEGWHWANGYGSTGCECATWKVSTGGRELMFFGDIRTYDARRFSSVGKIDISFAHVWLGRGEAPMENPSLLEPFCRFHAGFYPSEIILAHLNELSRSETDRWTLRHAEMVQNRFQSIAPEITVQAPGLLETVHFPPSSFHEKS